jgi:hypothetical protein
MAVLRAKERSARGVRRSAVAGSGRRRHVVGLVADGPLMGESPGGHRCADGVASTIVRSGAVESGVEANQ